MNTRIFYYYHDQPPVEHSDILLYVEGEDYPHLLYIGYGGRLPYDETELQAQLDNGKKAVYCYVEALSTLAFEIADRA